MAVTLTGFAPSVTFAENTVNATPQLIDSDVVFTGDMAFTGGALTLSGLLAEDRASIQNQGVGAGQIGFNSGTGTVTFGGVQIGTASGGSGATLTVTFNASATTAAVDALIQNLTYANVSDAPTPSRVLALNVRDASGATLAPPSFTDAGAGSPFAAIDEGQITYATFGDVDSDGDQDLLVGSIEDGVLTYYRNGTVGAPGAFAVQTGADNPFSGIVVPSQTPAPDLVDVDGDGDLDLVVGNNLGNLFYYRNGTDGASGVFATPPVGENPFAGIANAGVNATPTLADVDGDGDVDLLRGRNDGGLNYYLNGTTGTEGNFTLQTGAASPFNGITVGRASAPALFDVDRDGDLDLVIGDQSGSVRYFRNGTVGAAGAYAEQIGANNPFAGINVGTFSTPTFADIDGDGDADLVLGNLDGKVLLFRNGAGPAPTITVNVTPEAEPAPVNLPPVFDNFQATNSYTEDAAPVRLDADVLVTDLPGDFNGGSVSATIGNIVAGQDRLAAGVFGGITTAGTAVLFNGVQIGTITSDGVGRAFTVGLNAAADNAAVEALVESLTYQNISQVPDTTARSVTVTVSDAAGAAISRSQTLSVTSVPDAPVLTGVATSTTYVENAPAQLLDGDVTFVDGDYDGGFVSVSGLLAEDRVGVRSTGDGAGQIRVSGANLFFEGQAIGSFSGGVGGQFTADLRNTSVTARAVEALIEALTYSNVSDNPATSRTLTIEVQDDFGLGSNPPATADITVNVTPVNDGPTLAGFGPAVTFLENTVNAAFQLLDNDVTFADAEGNFDGGTLTLSGLLAEDRATVLNGAGITVLPVGGVIEIRYQGTLIGSATGGTGATLAITLNAAATSTAVDALIGQLAYANVSDTPTATRTLSLQVTDAAGATVSSSGIGSVTPLTGAANPFNGVDFGTFSAPVLVDIDGDNDLDLVLGGRRDDAFSGTPLRYFRNDDGATTFTELTGAANPFNTVVGPGDLSRVAFGDLDGDGDKDLLIGNNNQTGQATIDKPITAYRNDNGVYTALSGALNPFDGVFFDVLPAPAFADLDGDGDEDVVVGDRSGRLVAFRNENGSTAFTRLTTAENPFRDIDLSGYAQPSFVDLDGDGDLDLVVGGGFGTDAATVQSYRNTGGVFTRITGSDDVLANTTDGTLIALTFGDIDGDGDADVLLGNTDGVIRTFVNGPAITVTVTAEADVEFVGTAADDTFVVNADGTYTRNGQGPVALPANLTLNAGAGDDLLRIDNPAGGVQNRTFTYNGQGQSGDGTGDRLEVRGGAYTSAVFTYTNANDGSVVLTNGANVLTVNYTGLEPVLVDADAAPTTTTFNLPGSNDTIQLIDNGATPGDGQLLLDSVNGTFEDTTFSEPTGLLTINGGAGTLTVNQVAQRAGDLTITSGSSLTTVGLVALDGDLVLAAVGEADLNVNGGISNTSLDADTETVTLSAQRGVGVNSVIEVANPVAGRLLNVNVFSDSNGTGGGQVFINSNGGIRSNDGAITLSGGVTPATGRAIGAFSSQAGVQMLGELTSGAGAITLRGQGAATGAAAYGVLLNGAAAVVTSTSGAILIDGLGGATGSAGGQHGVLMRGGADVESLGAASIAVTGTGSAGSGFNNPGIVVEGMGTEIRSITATSTGTITLLGTASGTGQNANGVRLESQALVSSRVGDISLTGTSNASGSAGAQFGLGILAGADVVSTGAAKIAITGTGSTGSGFSNQGIFLSGTGTEVRGAGAGTITLTGTARGTGGDATGVRVDSNALISGTTGNITLTGVSDASGTQDFQRGVLLFLGADIESRGAADIAITGTGGTGSGAFNFGVLMTAAGTTVRSNEAGSTGAIAITGTARGTGTQATGVHLDDQALVSSRTGDITVIGTSNASGAAGAQYGVALLSGADIEGLGAANIAITGTGSTGSGQNNIGVLLSGRGTHVRSNDAASTGAITITGTGRGTGEQAVGVLMFDGALVSGRVGDVTVIGVSNATADDFNYGVATTQSTIESVGTADIVINGTGGLTGGLTSSGVNIYLNSQVRATGSGDIFITGEGRSVDSRGLWLEAGSTLSTTTGDILMRGLSGTGVLLDASTVQTGAGAGADVTINLTGGGLGNQVGGGAIIADGLRLLSDATATFTLNSALNAVNTIAGAVTGTISYTDNDALTVGSVTTATVAKGADSTSTGLLATGALALTAGALAVNANTTGSGVTLTTTATGMAQALAVAAGVTVDGGAGGITLNAGDDLTLAAGSTLTSTGAVVINLDTGAADAEGSTATLAGSVSGSAITVNGGGEADTVTLSGTFTGPVTVNAGAGNDTVTAGAGTQTLNGQDGADELNGLAGADTLNGGLGDDTLRGGADIDTAIFSGNRSQYTFTYVDADTVMVTGPDGVDTLDEVEFLTFADGTFSFAEIANRAPTLTGFGPTATFAENTVNATPQLLDADVVFGDADGNVGMGSLTVSGLLLEDRVSVRNEGANPGQIGFPGAGAVTFGGQLIGIASGGVGGTFTVTFNANATAAAIDALIQNLTYANVSDAPTASRVLTLNVTDAFGVGLAGGGQGITVNVTPGNDAPTPAADALSVLQRLTITGSVLTNDTDPDGDTLTVTLIQGAQPAQAVVAGGTTAQGTYGDLTVNPDGTISYYANEETLIVNQVVTDVFTYTVSDPSGATASSTVTFTVTGSPEGDENVNRIIGDGTNNTLNGYGNDDQLNGAVGDDVVNGGDGNDLAQGGMGDDVVDGGLGDDTVSGGAGNDVLIGGDGTDQIIGGDGIDTASYATATAGVTVNLQLQGSAQATGGAGSDTLTQIENLTGSAFNDTLIGDAGVNMIRGGEGADFINGSLGDDVVYGGDGNDFVVGGQNNDLVYGELGDDTVAGGLGNDTVNGGLGQDVVNGNDGDDLIQGGQGDDQLFGDAGNDLVAGGLGADILDGGAGADIFLYSAAAQSTTGARDLIRGFVSGTDKVDLTGIRSGDPADSFTITSFGNLTLLTVDLGGDGTIDLQIGFEANATVLTTDVLF